LNDEDDKEKTGALANIFQTNKNESDNTKSIRELLNNENKSSKERSREGADIYRSFLSFPYFLLQTLRLYLYLQKKKESDSKEKKESDNIIYNDAKLLELYQSEYFNEINKKEKEKDEKVKEKKSFIEFLFKMRILFDYFIVRRDESGKPYLRMIDEKFSANAATEEEKRKHINIQLLFNLTSDFKTQDWIAPALAFLYRKKENIFKKDNFDEQVYEDLWEFLENLDRCVALERLGKNSLQEVYKNAIKDDLKNESHGKTLKLVKALNRGTATEHYWFYKLDYLLWKDAVDEKEGIWEDVDLKPVQFTLKNLNSVEHIFPQNPTQGSCAGEKDKWEEYLNCFGNLALISQHMNSKLSNQCFDHKKVDIENQMKKGTIESLKMALVIKEYGEWTPENCCEHHREMIDVLRTDLGMKHDNISSNEKCCTRNGVGNEP
jgi:hypothetical protein